MFLVNVPGFTAFCTSKYNKHDKVLPVVVLRSIKTIFNKSKKILNIFLQNRRNLEIHCTAVLNAGMLNFKRLLDEGCVKMYKLDDTSWAILDELQKDAKKPLRDIAKKVGLTAPAVMERIKKMEADDIIKGYCAIVDPCKVGYNFRAILALKTNYNWAEDYVIKKYDSIPEIINYWSVTGEVEFYIEVILPNIRYLESLLKKLSENGRIVTSVVITCLPNGRKKIPCPAEISTKIKEGL